MKLGLKGRELIQGFEKLRLESYPDSGGVWTIGWGTTTLNGAPVTKGMVINKLVADALFDGFVQDVIDHIERLVKTPLTQNQLDALVSFTYNVGKNGFAKSSLLTTIKAKLLVNEDLFTRWNKGRVNGVLVELPGLTKRRKAEYKLFIS